MTRRTILATAAWAAVAAGAACHRAAAPGAAAAPTPTADTTADAAAAGGSAAAEPPAPPPADDGGQVAAGARRATVAQVADGALPAGRVVRVTGRCLGYGARSAEGPPPRTRSDWLLGSGGRAVYVVGAFPPGCEPMAGGTDDVTLRARVAVDTVAGLRGPGTPRRYLVRVADAPRG